MKGRPNTLESILSNAVKNEETGCLEWTLYRTAKGYGLTSYRGRTHFAYRIVYELSVGPIPDGLVLDHLCRNPACINVEHLEPVTPRTNLMRGNTRAAKNTKKTHCKRGHPFSGENLGITHRGGRFCKTCKRADTNRWHKLHADELRARRKERERRRRAQ